MHPANPARPSCPAAESHSAGRVAQSVLQLWQHYAAAATRPVRWCLVAAVGPVTLFYGMLLQVRTAPHGGAALCTPYSHAGRALAPYLAIHLSRQPSDR